ncbi:conserved unknown protein [Ectocarpus siliculosus]|uniref:O-fucosyltransferase family protein n=1 Tax=Ectocarpus siliculosus TaxID=2880 RepID=D7FTI4_ECTSI|nr:conserved unknown protein [Ectocarpus siliculosus]|eukprot:CBJ48562.1 conserved unknown protein [Ectocarpus siliculosus]
MHHGVTPIVRFAPGCAHQVQSEPLRDTLAEEERGNGPGDAADVPLTSKASSSSKKALLPEEGQLPEPPPATSAAEATEGAVEDGEGNWSDDGEAGGGGNGAGNGVHSLTVGGESVAAGAAETGTDAGVDEGERAEERGEPGQSRTEPDGGSEHQEEGEHDDRTEAAVSNLLDDMFASEEAAGAGAAAAAAAAAKLDAGTSDEAVSNLLDDMFASEEAAGAGAATAAAAAKLDAGTSDGGRNHEEKQPQTTEGDVGDAADDARSESTVGAGGQLEGGTDDSSWARGNGERGGGIDGEQDQDGLGPGAEDWGGGMADGAETGSASFRDELFGEGQQRAAAASCATTKLGEGVDSITNIATWRDVPGDAAYRHPLAEENASKYVTLQKDLGGFNNIRLSLECAVAIAAATGRTLVIPPPFQIWNMKGTAKKEVDLRELFSFDKLRASGRVNVITTAEFLEREAVTGNLGVQPDKSVMLLDVKAVEAYMEQVASQYDGGLPELSVERAALVMPRRIDGKVDLEDERYGFAKKWIYGRELLEYQGQPWEEAKVIHWRAKESRLLAPFYAFVLHADEASDQYHKRLLRDLMHYPEEVYCKASQIISLLRQEDPSGEFSTFHVRRNDFGKAYKSVMIDPADVIANSLDHLNDNEVVYVATDEKDLSVFEPFRKNVRVKFLSDYYERAGVSELNPNLIGMLEQVVASHGRTFTGCWLSTFTAYILRLRGHLQMPRKSNWSYYNPRKEYNQAYKLPENPLWMTEWPFGWERIDETGVPDPMAP